MTAQELWRRQIADRTVQEQQARDALMGRIRDEQETRRRMVAAQSRPGQPLVGVA